MRSVSLLPKEMSASLEAVWVRSKLSAQSLVNLLEPLGRRVRYPNALLSVLVLGPTLAMSVSASDLTADARVDVALAADRASVALGFGVGTVTIDGIRDTRESDVLDYLAVSDDTSLLRFDLEQARHRVRALPWVDDASIRRVLPGTLFVELTEHEPFARLFDRGRIHLVTVTGEEITEEINAPHDELPLVVGEGATRKVDSIFGELAPRSAVLNALSALEWVADRRWTLHMKEGVQVHLPERGVETALDQLELMMRDYAILDREITTLDLRRQDQLVVQLTDAGIQVLGDLSDGDGA